ncbi:MAG: isoleucine--tRNA ligase, partial [Candidatus Aenigmatarchaeota archaeon]
MESEKRIFELWRKRRIYEKAKEKNRGKKKFYFVDGPPYATGSIHMGTAWNKILKDLYLRFFRMKGRDVWDQPGYDTHGLPIENKVEKELGLMRKNDIEKFGVERFVKECRKFATKYIDVMNKEFANLGVWMDWDNPYLTLDNNYIQGGWATFKEAYRKGFLYRGLYPVHVCPRCETAVAYNEIEYEKVKDPSVYVKFRIKDKEYLLIFTTTPWTLPANTGVMAHPKKYYVKVRVGDEYYILAEERVEEVMELGGIEDYEVIERFEGKKLEGLRYEPVLEFDFQKDLNNGFRVVMSERFVSTDEGTGLVHTAPGHGKEDYQVGRENGLPVVSPVRINGTFDESVGKYSGKFVKAADKEIINELNEKGLLFHSGELFHDYPHCWRCDSPLLLISVEQWFLGITKIRDKLIEENQKVNWVPEFAKQRFHNWLNSLGDWPVSRQRYWGIPLPIWECESCGEIKVIGSAEELPEKPKDLHRPYIDEVTLKCKCGGLMRRVKDVMDVWFDSGLASWASLGYPKNRELFKRLWPADLNIEGPDQIRGWWNSQMIMSVLTFNRRPFENVVYHGFVLDAHGNKMSKSKGNVVTPEEVIERYGRDVLRFYL